MTRESMTIGQLAASTGVGVETVRFYQRRGLLAQPPKPLGGQRRYRPVDARRLRFVRRAQQLGFTLEEIGGLLALEDGCACREASLIAAAKLEAIESRIADLGRMRRRLREMLRRCETDGDPRSCPLIAALVADDPTGTTVTKPWMASAPKRLPADQVADHSTLA